MSIETEELRFVLRPGADEMGLIQVTEFYDVFRADELVGTIEMSSRTTYGIKPRVLLRSATGEVLFEGLWEERFVAHEEVAPAVARQFKDLLR